MKATLFVGRNRVNKTGKAKEIELAKPQKTFSPPQSFTG
jgi:hypothetical protein